MASETDWRFRNAEFLRGQKFRSSAMNRRRLNGSTTIAQDVGENSWAWTIARLKETDTRSLPTVKKAKIITGFARRVLQRSKISLIGRLSPETPETLKLTCYSIATILKPVMTAMFAAFY
jgi:hypothetical protein